MSKRKFNIVFIFAGIENGNAMDDSSQSNAVNIIDSVYTDVCHDGNDSIR